MLAAFLLGLRPQGETFPQANWSVCPRSLEEADVSPTTPAGSVTLARPISSPKEAFEGKAGGLAAIVTFWG